jgi:hypothetical protein
MSGVSRDSIAADNRIAAGTVSNILEEYKKGAQGSNCESVKELAIHCKKEGVNLTDLLSVKGRQILDKIPK